MSEVTGWREAVLSGGAEVGTEALAELIGAGLEHELPVLATDPDLRELALQSSAANIGLVVEILARSGGPEDIEAPPQALTFVRELARRNVPVMALANAYRRAEGELWRWAVGEVRRRVPPEQLATALESLTQAVFVTGSAFSRAVTERYASERERWLRSADAVRAETVSELLAGGPADLDSAGRRLGYVLRRQHLAFVVWSDTDEAAPAEDAAAIGGPRSLLVPTGALIAGWGPPEAIDPGAATEGTELALGTPGSGLAGFRRSHREALEARRVARLAGLAAVPARYEELALAALLTQDGEAAIAFAERLLGPLASDSERERRLTETIEVLLEEGGSPRRAGGRLGVHENTVAKRMRRAEELLGRNPTERPAEMLAALRIVATLRLGREAGGRPEGT